MTEFDIKKLLTKNMQSTDASALIVISSTDTYPTNDDIIRYLTHTYKKGAYLTLTFPAQTLLNRADFSKKESELIFFIDGISLSRNCTPVKNSLSFAKVNSLAELSLKITSALDSEKELHYFFTESLDDLLSRNEKDAPQFIQYLLKKLTDHDIKLSLISMKGGPHQSTIDIIEKLFDKKIDVST